MRSRADAPNNQQIDAYRKLREPKQHERELLQVVRDSITVDPRSFNGSILDIGCASGSLLCLLAEAFPQADLIGFDPSAELLRLGSQRLTEAEHTRQGSWVLHQTTEELFEPTHPMDIVIASGVLSIFDDIEPPLSRWLSWLSMPGTLFLFGRFNSRDVDTRVSFRNNWSPEASWEGGLTSYSLASIHRTLDRLGYRGRFTRFRLSQDLPEQEDPIRSYTVRLADGERLVANGANVIAEHYFAVIQRSDS